MTSQIEETVSQHHDNDSFASIDFDAISQQTISGDSSDKSGKKQDLDIDPAFAIYLMDIFVTRIVSVVGKFSGYEIKPNDIALTKTEINNIKPYAAKALEKMIGWIEGHEIAMFFFMLAITYGSKTILYSKKVEKGKAQKPPLDQRPAPKPRKRITKTSRIRKKE